MSWCCTRDDGDRPGCHSPVPVRSSRLSRFQWLSFAPAAGAMPRPGCRRRGPARAPVEIEEAWLVDPGSHREGVAALLVEHGVWSTSRRRAQVPRNAHRLIVSGLVDLHAHLREPGGEAAESRRDRPGSCGARGIHERLPDAQHGSADRSPGGRRHGPGGRRRRAGPRCAPFPWERSRSAGRGTSWARWRRSRGPEPAASAMTVPPVSTTPSCFRAALTEAGALGRRSWSIPRIAC